MHAQLDVSQTRRTWRIRLVFHQHRKKIPWQKLKF